MAKRLNLPRAGASQPVAPAAAAPGGGHSRLSGAVSRMALDSPAPPPPFASSQGSEDPAAGPNPAVIEAGFAGERRGDPGCGRH